MTIACCAALLPLQALAQTCTTFVNASDGHDGNPGTQILPLRSIEFAFNNRPSGSVVCVAGGEYFFGDDADGITLSGDKSVTFVLNSFAGIDEIRISERHFRVDSGSGTITFASGTTNKLVIGRGIANITSPSTAFHFVHSLFLTSGTLDVSGVVLEVEESVGNPGYSHPGAGGMPTPSSAAIEIANGLVQGIISFEDAERVWRFVGGGESVAPPGFPADVGGNRIEFEQSGTTTWTAPVNFSGATLEFRHSGQVMFQEDVTIDLATTVLISSASFAGDTEFRASLEVYDSGAAGGIEPSFGGGGDIHIALLRVVAGAGQPTDLGLLFVNSGQLAIEQFEADAAQLNLDIRSGSAVLGSAGGAQELPGPTILRSTTALAGEISVPGFGAEPSLIIESPLSTGGFHLATGPGGSHIVNNSVMDAGATIGLLVTTDARLEGSGQTERVRVESGILTLAGHEVTSSFEVFGSGSLDTTGNATLDQLLVDTSGAVSVSSGSTLNLVDFFATTGDVTLTGEMRATGGVSIGTTASVIGEGALVMAGETQSLVIASDAFQAQVRVETGSTSVSSPHPLPALSVSEGAVLLAESLEDLIFAGVLEVAGSAVVTAESIRLIAGASLDEGGSLSLTAPSGLELGGVLRLGGSGFSLDTPFVTPIAGSTVVIDSDVLFVLPSLLLDKPNASVTIIGAVGLPGDLLLQAGEIIIESGSTLSVKGNVTRSGGIFEPLDGGVLVLDGLATQTVSGFTGSVLPSLRLEGTDIRFQEDVTVLGSVDVASGSTTVEGVTLTMSGDLTLSGPGGSLSCSGAGSLWVGGDASLSDGSLSMATGSLDVSGDLSISGATLSIANALIRLHGLDNVVLLEGEATVRSITIEDASALSFTTGHWQVRDDLTIDAGARLNVQEASISLLGDATQPTLTVNGVVSGPGSITFLGPSASTVFRLGGSGLLGNINIDLINPDSDLIVLPGSDALRVGGNVHFQNGGIDLAGRALFFDGNEQVPTVSVNLTGQAQAPSIPRGRGFVDSALGEVTLQGGAHDLEFGGSVTTVHDIADAIGNGFVRNLSITTEDPINSPPVFGVRLSEAVQISGALTVAQGALLRISGVEFVLAGSAARHAVPGTITGTGTLRLTGSSSELRGNPQTFSRLPKFVIDSSGQGNTTLADIKFMESFEIRTGNVLWLESPIEATISGSVTILSGSHTFLSRWRMGTGGSGASLVVTGARVGLGRGSAVTLAGGASLQIDPSALVEMDGSQGAVTSSDGFITLEGAASVSAPGGLPRLRVAAITGTSASDDVVLGSALLITQSFLLDNGDVFLGPHDLMLEGLFRFDIDQTPFDGGRDAIFGDGSQDSGALVFVGSTDVLLGSDLEISGAPMYLTAGSGRVSVESGEGGPYRITLDSQSFYLDSGTLDLGQSDLLLNGSIAGVLRLDGGHIEADYTPSELPATGHLMPALQQKGFFPYLDTDFGEIVLSGSGNTSIAATSPTSIPNLRINGSARIEEISAHITIGNRFVFGLDGASLTMNTAGQFRLDEGATIVRRGRGTLSHPLPSPGPVHVFYDLDNGTLTGVDTEFDQGSLSTGNELPAVVGKFGVMAGNRGATVHSVSLARNIFVRDGLAVLSGNLDIGAQTVTLAGGALIAVDQPDAQAPGGISQSTTLAGTGLIDLFLSARTQRLDVGSINLGDGLDIDSLWLYVEGPSGGLPATARLVDDLQANTFTMTGAGSSGAFRLDGHDLTTTSDLTIEGGSMSSTPVSQVGSGGTLSIGPGASIQENLLIRADDVHLEGTLSTISLTLDGDFFLSGQLASSTVVTFDGSWQTLHLEEDLEVGTLRLEQMGQGMVPRVTFQNSGAPVDIRIGTSLELAGGILTLGPNRLLLPGKSGGVSRSGAEPTHVDGRISRTVAGDETGTYFFPVGDSTTYRPLSIEFSTQALSTSQLEVLHSHSGLMSRQGLPISTPDGLSLTDTAPFSWRITSSVDFAQSQPVTIVASIEAPLVESTQQHRLVYRQAGSITSPWIRANGSPSASLSPVGRDVRSQNARGLLVPAGIDLTVAAPRVAQGSESRIQFANLTASSSVGIRVGSLSQEMSQLQASGTSAVGLAMSPASVGVELFDPGSGDVLFAKSVSLESAARNILAAIEGEDGAVTLAHVFFEPATDQATYLAFAHLAEGVGELNLARQGEAEGSLAAGLDFGSATDLHAFSGSPVLIDAFPAGVSFETFSFSNAGLAGQTSLGGFVRGEAFGQQEGSVQLLVVGSDGTVLQAGIVTGVETGDPELPAAFRLTGNYPNPFSSSTTLTMDLPETAQLRVVVVDMLGRVVDRVDVGLIEGGSGAQIRLDGSQWASGAYLYRVEARGITHTWTETGTMVRVR